MDSQFDIKTRLYASRYIDCHCHQTKIADVFALQSIDLSDFSEHAALPDFYTVGIHPWRINYHSEFLLGAIENSRHLLAIGECGLDKAINLPLAYQIPVFEQQINLAACWNKPLIIHCVRAYNELLAIKSAHETGRAWLIHGCNTSYQQVQQLLAAGFYFSFGSILLNPSSRPAQYLRDLPLDRWLLETDANTHFGIDLIYSCAAKILGWEVGVLHQQMVTNFERIFLND